MTYRPHDRAAQLITTALPVASRQDNDADNRALEALAHDSLHPRVVYLLATTTASVIADYATLTGVDPADAVARIAQHIRELGDGDD